MPDTPTPNLSLVRPLGAEKYDVGVVNANNTSIDAAVGVLQKGLTICTRTTRPANPAVGNTIYETDTGIQRLWTGTKWRWMSGTQVFGFFPLAANQGMASGTNINPVLGGKTVASSRDPEDNFNRHADTKGVTVTLAGFYRLSLELNWTPSNQNYGAWFDGASTGTYYMGQVPAPGGSTSLTTRLLYIAAGATVRAGVYNYGSATSLAANAGAITLTMESEDA